MRDGGFPKTNFELVPIGSMYDIFTYIWLVNVGKDTIHGWYGVWNTSNLLNKCFFLGGWF